MKELKERCDMNQADCWDLSYVIQDDKEYAQLIHTVKNENKNILSLKGHILDHVKNLKLFLKSCENETRALERLLIYNHLSCDENKSNNQKKAKELEIENLYYQIQESESFISSELMEHDLNDVLKLLKEDESLKIYERYFRLIYKDKDRILSEQEERIIALAHNAFGTPSDAFDALDTADAFFDSFEVKGKTFLLNHYNYRELLENPDREVRRKAWEHYYHFYELHKNTYASLLTGNYKELEFVRTIRKYPSALEMALDSINVSQTVYDNLIQSVNRFMDLNVKFQKMKAELLHLQDYHLYDTYVPVVEKPKESYSKEEAIELIHEALKPLGEDYWNHFETILHQHTIDYYPNVGKQTGAYQTGCYDSPSYVLLNFDGSFDSVSTFAHEMGHAVHSMYAKENNPFIYSDYELFLAEIASTVNETLLSMYVMDHAKEKKEKIYYLCEFLDKVKATIYRQTMFSEFERILSEKMQKKESLTEEIMSDIYYQLNEEYFKDSVIIDPSVRYEWMYISHFYRPFYVYQYATGLISALSIVSDIIAHKENAKENYIDFLKTGSRKDVLDILKDVNVDLNTFDPFEKAFHFIEQKVSELELLKEGEENE